nr:HEAT repeat domain-containing protein [uncultured Desulfobacter sp.]
MKNRIFSSLAILCICLLGGGAYLLMSGEQNPEISGTVAPVSDKIEEKITNDPAQDTVAAKVDQKTLPQPESENQTIKPESQIQSDFLAVARLALNDSDIPVRIRTIRRLRNEVSEDGLALVQQFLDDPDDKVVASALNTLAIIGQNELFRDQVYTILKNCAVDKNFSDRATALVIAAQFGKNDDLLPVIYDYISVNDSSSQIETANISLAATALSALGTPACVDPLREILALTNDSQVTEKVFYSLSRIGSPEATTILQQQLTQGDIQNRVNSAMALAVVNKPEYNDILLEAVVSQDVNEQVLKAIARSAAGPEIFKQAFYDNEIDRQTLKQDLGILKDSLLISTNETRKGIMETVAPLLDSEDAELEVDAIKIMGMGFGDEDTVDVLEPKLKSTDTEVRKAAVYAYGCYIKKDNYKPLLDLIWDDDEAVRRQAFGFAMEYIDQTDYAILEKAKNHEDELIREQISAILN